jgi:glucose-1-phosphate thymidylyltransferase
MGTRLRPHTFTVPKVLLNVAGRPILGHILDKILGEGITSATVVVGHMSEKIREFVESTYPSLKAEYVQQDDPMGLGHAIYLSREYLKDEPVLIILGDTIFDVDLKPVLRGTETAIGVKRVDDPRRFGVAETDGGTSRGWWRSPRSRPATWRWWGSITYGTGGVSLAASNRSWDRTSARAGSTSSPTHCR